MKYIVILGDGMADYPVPELLGKTPLECAHKPIIDSLAQRGLCGLVKTVPDGIAPGSDVANLSVMGYDPSKFYTGRSPLEAVSMGISLGDIDLSLRCNLVTLSEEENYLEKTMIDYSSDEISTSESAELIHDISKHLSSSIIKFYPGISYRHLMVWEKTIANLSLTPPHDIQGKVIKQYLPSGDDYQLLVLLMQKSNELLKDHPVNQKRKNQGLRPANSIWLWGEGRRPSLPSFYDKYKIKSAVISAVDLLKGIGICAGLTSIDVVGATGNINTNFEGKANAAIHALEEGHDLVYLHIEAPDECGHRHEVQNKIRSIELIDEKVMGIITQGLRQFEDYKILILPDHATPLTLRTHTNDPVPFIIYHKSQEKQSGIKSYTEPTFSKAETYIAKGHTLMDLFINGTISC